MAESRLFNKREGITSEGIGRCVQHYLKNKGLAIQGGRINDRDYVVQAKQESGWRKISGMDNAIEVQITETGENFLVNIGNAKWADKVGAGVIGAFVFAPLAVTAVVGTVQQKKLPAEIFAEIERYIISGGQELYVQADTIAVSAGMQVCPKCKREVPIGQAFCASCGTSLTMTCPSCGKPMPLGTKFCPICGKPADAKKTVPCPKCGADCETDAAFCMKCGAKLGEVQPPEPVPVQALPEPQQVICPKCGEANDPDDAFCCECGEKLTAPEPEPANCPECGAPLKPGKSFCSKCGHKFN
jgi:predicted amidophosphoribosyltransferase